MRRFFSWPFFLSLLLAFPLHAGVADAAPGVPVLLAGLGGLALISLALLVLWIMARKALKVQAEELTELDLKLTESEKRRRAKSEALVASRDAMEQLENEHGQLVSEKASVERRFGAVLEALPVAVSIRDADGDCDLVNRFAREQGLDEEAVEKLAAQNWSAWDAALHAGETMQEGEEQWPDVQAQEGQTSPWRTRLFGVRDEQGELLQIGSVSMDQGVIKAMEQEVAELNLDLDEARKLLRNNQDMLDEQYAETGRMAGLLEIADEQAETMERQHEEVLEIRACHVAQGVNTLVGLGLEATDAALAGKDVNAALTTMKQEALNLTESREVVLADELDGARIGLLFADGLETRMLRGYLEPKLNPTVASDSEALLELIREHTLDGIVLDTTLLDTSVLYAAGKSELPVIGIGEQGPDSETLQALLPKPLKVSSLFAALAEHVTVAEVEAVEVEATGVEAPAAESDSVIAEATPEDVALPKLPGIDTEVGLVAHQGDTGAYRQALLDFSAAADRRIEDIMRQAGARDWSAMERGARELMSEAESLGAKMLVKAADNVIRARGTGTEVQPLLPPLKASTTFVCHSIRNLSSPAPQIPQANRIRSVDPYVLQPRLTDLALLVEQQDAEATACLDTIRELYKETEIQPDLERIHSHLTKSDYSGSLRLTNALLNHLGESMAVPA